jgi:hypothetical protein
MGLKETLIYFGIGILAAVLTYPFRPKLGGGSEPKALWYLIVFFMWPALLLAALMVPFLRAWDWHNRPMSKGVPIGIRIRKAIHVLIGRE